MSRARQAPAMPSASDRFLEFLGGAEGNLLRRLDLDLLAGRRVAAHAGGALTHLKDTEPANANALAFLEALDHQADHVAEDSLGSLLRHIVVLRQFGGEMLKGDGRRGSCLRGGHDGLCSSLLPANRAWRLRISLILSDSRAPPTQNSAV